MPDFGTLKPKATGTGVAFELEVARRGSNYGIRFEGVFPAEAAGGYTFTLSSDDGSRLLIDGKKVVDNDGVHPTQTASGTVELTKGIHKITVDFFQSGGEAVLDVEVESRNLGRQPLAPLWLSQSGRQLPAGPRSGRVSRPHRMRRGTRRRS